jgi:dTMP kinase
MFVVFEGIDGGGKTTLSNLVANKLRASGLRVAHVREGGKFASSVTQGLRELGRDSRNLALTPRAELMLYLTREVQLLEEATRPALADMDVVIADRFVYTAEVLAVYGRRLPADEVEPLVTAAAGELRPDLVVLVDVEPTVARARRRVAKLVAPDDKPPSRKGLAGTALQQRLRVGYRELAARDPQRWIVIDNTEADLAALADALATLVRSARDIGLAAARQALPQPRAAPVLAGTDRAAAKTALLAWIDRRSEREPGLAAYFLESVPGAELDQRRRALADRAPTVIAAGLKLLNDAASWRLRHELAARAGYEIARSIVGEIATHPEAAAVLRAIAPSAPRGVGEALSGREDALAWELRALLPPDAVMLSLGAVRDPRAWQLRDRWIEERGGFERLDVAAAAIACISVSALEDDRAWALRKALREVAPVAALESTLGLTDDRSWRWRERYLERGPKVVMKTIAGFDDARAWQLRARVVDHCEETFDSLFGLDGPQAWSLRDAHVDRWPATVVKSLGALGRTERGQAFVDAVLARHPTNVALWRQAMIATG